MSISCLLSDDLRVKSLLMTTVKLHLVEQLEVEEIEKGRGRKLGYIRASLVGMGGSSGKRSFIFCSATKLAS